MCHPLRPNRCSTTLPTRVPRTGFLAKLAAGAALLAALASAAPARAQGSYNNFSVTVYFLMREIKSAVTNMTQFSNQWANVEKQVKIDKVYLETTRDSQVAEAAEMETMKKFFYRPRHQGLGRHGPDRQ